MADETELDTNLRALVGSNESHLAGLSTLQKGHLIERGTEPTRKLPHQEEAVELFTEAGALIPPYDPATLCTLFEHSNSLRQNVDAYATNIDAFGHKLEPTINTEASDAVEKVGDALYLERLRDAERIGGSVTQVATPEPDEVDSRIREIKILARLEAAKLGNFFESACPESSFIELRKQTRADLEVTGNAYWEVLRNSSREVAQLVYVPAYSMRLLPVEFRFQEVAVSQRMTPLTFEKVPVRRRFRLFVQLVLNRLVYFKEFGDPRTISSKTGKPYATVEALRAAEGNDILEASEIIHFKIHSPRSAYGVPRWIGQLLSVLGSRASEEVNYFYFGNKAVPPLAVLVSGGTLTEDATKRLETYVKDQIRGRENFHKILIIEAETQTAIGQGDQNRVRIQIEKLRDAQEQDALFQGYDERNIDKVGMAFRMPRLLRGDIRDFNRATADAAERFAERQVFQPERETFDSIINRTILAELGIRFWKFVSNSPISRDPLELAEIAAKLATVGGLVPADIRELARDIFNRELRTITDDWVNLPLPLAQAGFVSGAGAPASPAAQDVAQRAPEAKMQPSDDQRRLASVVAQLTRLKEKLVASETKAYDQHFQQLKREVDDDGVITLALPKAEIDALFEPSAAE